MIENSTFIYVPDTSYSCYVVQDKDTIRAYKEIPVVDSTVNYRDYYINSHYLYKDSSEYISEIPVCLDSTKLTNIYGYRNDFSDICIISIIIIGSVFFLVNSLVKNLFKGRKLF